jgi:hypothetical protein
VLLTFLVFCVVFLVGSVTPCYPSSVFGGICDSMLLISLVFCVVFLVGCVTPCCSSFLFSVLCFWWGSLLRVAHLFSFLCCVYGGVRDSVLLIFLEQHGVTNPTINTTQKTKKMSNTESRTPPKTQHRKLKR